MSTLRSLKALAGFGLWGMGCCVVPANAAAAAFGAAVYLQRLLRHYRIDDLADIKVGWANPSLLGTGRGSEKYRDVRTHFLGDMMTLGIDITHATFPAKLSATAWPGVPAVFAALVGALPKEMTT